MIFLNISEITGDQYVRATRELKKKLRSDTSSVSVDKFTKNGEFKVFGMA